MGRETWDAPDTKNIGAFADRDSQRSVSLSGCEFHRYV